MKKTELLWIAFAGIALVSPARGELVTLYDVADVGFSAGTLGTGNAGKYGYMNADIADGGTRRMMMRWDLSSIPAGAQINSAQVFVYRLDGTAGYPFSIYRLTSEWTEGCGRSNGSTGAGLYPSGANWANRKIEGADGYGEGDPLDTDDPTPWNTPGGDYAVESRVQFTGAHVSFFGMQPKITKIVQDWVSGKAPNHGIVILSDETAYVRHAMLTRDYGYPDDGQPRPAPGQFAPQLVIDYTKRLSGTLLLVQ